VAGQSFTVTQQAAAPACTFVVSPTKLSEDWKGGNDSITVTAPSQCAWTAVSQVGWITIKSGTSGSGSGTVQLTVDKNQNKEDGDAPGSSRTGTVTVE
jgi:hypothetical protein